MERFQTDEQTLRDLEIFGERNTNSIAALFDKTVSKGGELALMRMLQQPVADVVFLENRKAVIEYFARFPDFIDIDRNLLAFTEIYLEQEMGRKSLSVWRLWLKQFRNTLKPDNAWNVCQRGVRMLGQVLYDLERWSRECVTDYAPAAMQYYPGRIRELIGQSALRQVLKPGRLTLPVFGELDFLFREKESGKVRELLDILYELEALRAVAESAGALGFTYPEYTAEPLCIEIEGLFHPFLSGAVRNDALITPERHICFLTGPNMAGKSTYMKAWGIAVYLAHLGFPVPAEKMKISVFQGLYTTVNLADDLNLGYSHYYSEVRRIKSVAEKMAELKDIVVISDELFRGTNVKDAYEASLAVISSFAGLSNAVFILSTHILEVAEALKGNEHIDFRFFEIENREGEFCYTYLLRPGISSERLGMYILDREKVVETIRRAGKFK